MIGWWRMGWGWDASGGSIWGKMMMQVGGWLHA